MMVIAVAGRRIDAAGMIVAPRIYSTGTILYGANLPIRAEVNSLDDARSHIRRLKAVGAITVKSYNQPRREQRIESAQQHALDDGVEPVHAATPK